MAGSSAPHFGLEEGEEKPPPKWESYGPFTKMKATWGCGNEIFFHDYHRGRGKPDRGKSLFDLKAWPTLTPQEKILLHDWHRIFHGIRKSMHGCKDIPGLVHQTSLQYLPGLITLSESLSLGNKKEDAELIEVCRIIWILFQIFYLDPSLNVTQQMAEWMRKCSPMVFNSNDPNYLPTENMDSKDGEKSWESIMRLVINGSTDEAIEALIRMGVDDSKEGRTVIELLGEVPTLDGKSRSTTIELLNEFHRWKLRVEACATSGHLSSLLSIMRGDKKTLEFYAQNPFELLVGRLIYEKPEITKQDIRVLVTECTDQYEDFDEFESCLKAIMDGDIMDALQKCQVIVDRPWFLAHLVDLLALAGWIPKKIEEDSEQNYLEYCLIEYASSIMTHPTLWQLSIAYFAQCGERGKAHIRTLIESKPIQSARESVKMLSMCDTHSLVASRSAICNRLGAQALRNERFGEAVNWYVRSGASQMVSKVCITLLQRLLDDEDVGADVESVSMNFSTVKKRSRKMWASLTLLDEVHSFCKLRAEVRKGEIGQAKEAVQIALKILAKKLGHAGLWLKILSECAKILKRCSGNVPVLSSRDSLKLLHHLEHTCTFSKLSPGEDEDSLEKSMRSMRIVFSRTVLGSTACER